MKKSPLRTLLILAPVAAVLGIAVAMLLRQVQQPVASTSEASDALLENGMKIDASFTGLKDPQGAAFDEQKFAGKYRLVSFGFTSCPHICPTMLTGLRQGLEQLGPDADRIVPVFISVDPENDTPERLGKYVASFDPRIVGLVGPQEALDKVARDYKAYFAKQTAGAAQNAHGGHGGVDHTSIIYLIDPQQRIRALISTSAGPQQIAADINQAVKKVTQSS